MWKDLKNDLERYNYIISGKAVEEGIISWTVADEMAEVFKYRHEHHRWIALGDK